VSKTLASLNVRIGATSKDFEKAMNRTVRRIEKFERKINKLGSTMTKSFTLPLIAAGGGAVKAAADIERMETSIAILTGSAEKAGDLMKDLQKFSANTPFQLSGIAETTKQLLAFGFSIDETKDALQFMGDISSATGSNLSDLTLILGQAKAIGKVFTQDLRQLANRGIPIFDILKEKLGVTGETLQKMVSDGKISFDILQDALKSTTMEGGLFADGMSKQANTLTGIWSTMKDNISLALGELGQDIVEVFDLKEVAKNLIGRIQQMVKWWNSLEDGVKRNIIRFSLFVAAVGPALLVIGKLVGLSALVATGIKSIGTALIFASKGMMFLLSPVGLTVAALTGLALLAADVYNNWDAFKGRFQNIWISIKNFVLKAIDGILSSLDRVQKFLGLDLFDFEPMVLDDFVDVESFKPFSDTLDMIKGKFLDITGLGGMSLPALEMGEVDPVSFGTPSSGGATPGGATSGSSGMTEGMERSVGTVEALSTALKDLSVSSDSVGSSLSKIPEMVPDELLTGLESVVLSLAGTFKQLALSSDASFGKMANAALSAGQKFVKAKIYEGVSAAVSSALTNVPFPFNIAAGAGAGLAANALFNKAMGSLKIPQFEKGGQYMGGLALVGEAGPELINFNQGGHVTNNDDLMSMMQSPRGSTEVKFGKITFDGRDLVLGYESGLNLLGRSRG